jgi:hypothetical protein
MIGKHLPEQRNKWLPVLASNHGVKERKTRIADSCLVLHGEVRGVVSARLLL